MSKENYNGNDSKKERLKHKYRFSIYNDTTYKQLWQIRLSKLEALILINVIIVAIIAFVIVMIAFTPLREFIPGYPDDKTRSEIVHNALRADSLETVISKWELQLANFNRIVEGKDPIPVESQINDSLLHSKTLISRHSKEDSLLRLEVEREIGVGDISIKADNAVLTSLSFFPPVKGIVTDKFDHQNGHFATDIVTAPNAPIASVLEGTVTMAAWTNDTGNVIQIQHKNNVLSIYKHCAKLLKKPGDNVKAGEIIAFVGNSGMLSSGAHLHFELWYDGLPVDPERYIIF
ncbi:MAG: M23 family metallopeptidase [Prevotellaceae bacterium]|jgi:murein DD-endopeptidase MepM/ murein hydrolase activator NlpD|nr:M23 family metallopeptidase [Prevotellaceae bacterium]